MRNIISRILCIAGVAALVVTSVVIGCRQEKTPGLSPDGTDDTASVSQDLQGAENDFAPPQAEVLPAARAGTFDPAQPAKLPGVKVNPPGREAIIARLFNPNEGMPGIGVLDIRLDKPIGQVYKAENGDLEAAISVAARSYALLTGEFQVNIRDIVESGLWPYESFDEVEFSLGITNGDCLSLQGLEDGKYTEIDTQIGSAGWVTSARARILLMALKGLVADGGVLGSVKFPISLPNRASAFWINPYLGIEMVESGMPGDFKMVPFGEVLGTGSKVCHDSELNMPLLPRVNQVLSALEGGATRPGQPNTKTASDGPWCCLFERHVDGGINGTQSYKECWDIPCGGEDECCVEWTITGSYSSSWWVKVDVVECDDPLPPNGVFAKVGCGNDAPDSIWAWYGTVDITSDTCYQCVTLAYPANSTEADYARFIQGLAVSGEGPGSTSRRGDKCNCV